MGNTQHKMLYRVSRAAEVLDSSRSQLYKLINEGTIQTVKIGRSLRIPASELEKLAKVEKAA